MHFLANRPIQYVIYSTLLFTMCCPAFAGKITTFQVPGAAYTYSYSINSSNEVTGTWLPSFGSDQGFIRDSKGVITTFALSKNDNSYTLSAAINRKGDVTGSYSTGSRHSRGFLRNSSGHVASFRVPGANNTSPGAINAAEEIAGEYFVDQSQTVGGFTRSRDGTVTTIVIPGCSFTTATSLNDLGDVAGFAESCGSGPGVALLRTANGAISTFSVDNDETAAYGINAADAVTGTSINGDTHVGFVRTSDGSVTTFNVPGSSYTEGRSINASGTICGEYEDADGYYNGFVRAPDGTIKTFSVRGEYDTMPNSINDRGVVTGTADGTNEAVGFIWRP